MAHSRNKILLLVEGRRTEPIFFRNLSRVRWNDKSDITIVDIRTNIYVLYNKIIKNDVGFFSGASSTIDVLKMILNEENRKEDLEKLNDKYAYVYLIFDFDFQDTLFQSSEKEKHLKDMKRYFNNETDEGLLLINYPMIESYRDFQYPFPDLTYKTRSVDLSVVCQKQYKQLVNERGCNLDINKCNIDFFEQIFLQNLKKANFVVYGEFCIPNYDTFIKSFIYSPDILLAEFKEVNEKGVIQVLNTCLFMFVSYYGEEYYNSIISHFENNEEYH